MKTNLFLTFLLGQFIFTSCMTSKLSVKDFVPFEEPAVFNGTYINKNDYLSRMFELYDEETNFISIEYNPDNPDTLKLSYYTEDGLKHSYFKGKRKKNYFEIYLHNTRIYIPAFMIVEIERLRIGSGKESDLLIQHYHETAGWLLFFAAGGLHDDSAYNVPKFNISTCNFLIPHRENEKWGFIDSTQHFVINPEYDFVRLFDKGVARVKQNGKWGLINEQGEKITEIKYDEISPVDTVLTRVQSNNKIGYIDINGKEIFSPEYDELRLSTFDNRSIRRYKKNNKYGYATNKGVLSLPIFDKADEYFYCQVCFFQTAPFTVPYAKVKYNNESYIVDKEGCMCRYKCSVKGLTIFEESKINIFNPCSAKNGSCVYDVTSE